MHNLVHYNNQMHKNIRILQRPALKADSVLHESALLNRIYAARGLANATQADLHLRHLLPPDALKQLPEAVALLTEAIRGQQRIVVVGDFDCDGATGVAVAVRGLRMLGAEQVFFKVPHRILHGYGLTPPLVDELAEFAPELVITVDSGIACIPGVARAKALGYRVLVTDHHLPGEQLPDADAIVNPNQPGCAFASKAMAGVGVVFYLLLAVRQALRISADQGAEADLSSLLDLVAIGTIADMVKLDANNRRLVRAGLSRINKGQCQPGVLALMQISGLREGRITETDIGFRIAPKINAAGRLEDMALGIECLLADDMHAALDMAESLHAINLERQDLQSDMLAEAEAVLSGLNLDQVDAPPAVVMQQAHWHPGIIGLLASKLKEQSHRPTAVFAPSEPGSDQLRGSCRSIAGFHMRDALAHLDAQHPGLITRFGGHAMAAGLSLPIAHFERFSQALQAIAGKWLDADVLDEILWTDGALTEIELSREQAEAVQQAGPWGQGFALPLFDNEFELLGWQVLKEKHLKLRLRLAGSTREIGAIYFNGYRGQPPPAKLRAVYELQTNDFREKRDFQCLIRHYEPV